MGTFAWDDLRYFLAFARAGSMQAAAIVLGVNQSTVQRRIAELEERVGHRLVERHLGSYRMTELGQQLLPAAAGVEDAIASFERHLAASNKAPTGILRLTCGSGVADVLQRTPLIDRFQAQYPGLRIELVTSDRYLGLSKGEADIAIRLGEPDDEALVGRKIADASWAVYASRTYVERHGRPRDVGDLNRHFIVGCDGPIKDYPGPQALRSLAPGAAIATRCDHWQGVMIALKAGAGLVALPHWLGDREREIVRVIDDIGLVTPFYLLMHRDMQHSPRVRAFADFVASEIGAFRGLFSQGGHPGW